MFVVRCVVDHLMTSLWLSPAPSPLPVDVPTLTVPATEGQECTGLVNKRHCVCIMGCQRTSVNIRLLLPPSTVSHDSTPCNITPYLFRKQESAVSEDSKAGTGPSQVTELKEPSSW